jgi:hypothetical protein
MVVATEVAGVVLVIVAVVEVTVPVVLVPIDVVDVVTVAVVVTVVGTATSQPKPLKPAGQEHVLLPVSTNPDPNLQPRQLISPRSSETEQF